MAAQPSAEMFLVFVLVVGIGLCIYIAARTAKVRFSLQTIFVLVTVACVLLALSAAVGANVIGNIALMVLGFVMPLLNLMAIGVLIVLVINSRGMQQALQIGRVTPLVGLALLELGRGPTFGGEFPFGIVILLYYSAFYVAAWFSGKVSAWAYLNYVDPTLDMENV